MKITFGMHLDGWRSVAAATRFDELHCGPLGLLDQLELRLGLASSHSGHARRVRAYHNALEEVRGIAGRFYSDSFEKDPIAAAEVLLAWRDELVLGGWTQTAIGGQSSRLAALSAVEERVGPQVRSGPGDRVQRIITQLDTGTGAGLAEIEVIDRREHLPALLVRLLRKLGARFVTREAFPLALEGSNLRRAQEAILGDHTPFAWNTNGDDSLMLCTAHSDVALAQVAARWISQTPVNEGLLLSTSPSAALDSAMAGLGVAAPGLRHPSAHRPVGQVLRLALRLHWSPLNPQHLLEFLVHPVCPLRSMVRQQLAAAVAEQPGIGGRAWCKAIERIKAIATQWREAEDQDQVAAVEQSIRDWLMVERFDLAAGAQAAALIITCKRVEQWARARAARSNEADDSEPWHLLANSASELAGMLEGADRVGPTQLDRLLALIDQGSAFSVSRRAQLGSIRSVDQPGAVLESVQEVFWWCAEHPGLIGVDPWTPSERQSLAAAGIHLLSREAKGAAQRLASLRPLLAARSRLRLFLPAQRAGEPVDHHPLLDELRALAKAPMPTLNVDEALLGSSGPAGAEALSPHPLPPLRRWWRLPEPNLLGPRRTESFSSLKDFIYQPFVWVLRHRARLEEGAAVSFGIQADQRQRGNLIHRLAEWLFAADAGIDWRGCSEEVFDQWVRHRWLELLETEGANLLLPGMLSEGESLRLEAQRALWSLLGHLRDAGVEQAEADKRPATAPFLCGSQVGRPH